MYIKGLGLQKIAEGYRETNLIKQMIANNNNNNNNESLKNDGKGYGPLPAVMTAGEISTEQGIVNGMADSVFKRARAKRLDDYLKNSSYDASKQLYTATAPNVDPKPVKTTTTPGGSGSTEPKSKKGFGLADIGSWIVNNPGATAGLATGALLLATDPFGMVWRQHKPGESPVNIGSLLGTGLVGGGLYAGLKYAPELFGNFSNLNRDTQERKDAQKAADKATGFGSRAWNGIKDTVGLSNNDLLEGLLKTKDLDNFIKQAEPLLSMPEVKDLIGDPRNPNWGAKFKLGLDPDIILRGINSDETLLNRLKAQHIDPKILVQVLKHYHNLYKGN